MQTITRTRKVLLVITKANWGGAQKYVYDVATELASRGYDAHVAFGGNGDLVKRLKEAGITTHELKTLKNDIRPLSSMATLFELYSLFRTERPDVVHLNSSKIGFFGTIAGKLARIPHIIFTAHGWPFNEERALWQKAFLRILMQITVLLAHRTICVSRSTLKTLEAPKWISKKCVVIHNGIARVPFLPTGAFFTEQNLALPQRTTLFSIGELHKSKGYDLALQYLKKLKDLSWEWHIIGEGKERQTLEHLIKEYDLSDRVFLHGYLFGSPYIPSFDIFFLPSRTEGLAYVAIEALQSNLPIIASDAGGLPEALGEDPGTTLITIRDNKSEKTLRQILQNPPAKIESSAREQLRKEFSLSHMIDEIEKVYRR